MIISIGVTTKKGVSAFAAKKASRAEDKVVCMSEDNAQSRGDEGTNGVDPWVQSQLSAYHLDWLQRQKEAVDPAEILKFALAEWVVRHPNDWFGDGNVGIAMRSALDEFIARHKEEFISTA
jgi:hypothetical protein